MTDQRGDGADALSNRQRKILVKKIKKEQAEAASGMPIERSDPYQAPKVNGETEVHATGKSGKTIALKLGRLEYLQRRGVITPRMMSAGLWLADQWSGYFAPSSSSGIEDQAPGSVPSDPLARWSRGQRVMDNKGNPRTPPPTFRPRKPAAPCRSHDGFTYKRLENLQKWIRARRLIDHLTEFDRKLLIAVCVEGHTLSDAARLALGSRERAGNAQRLHRRALESLWRALTAIADEIEPPVTELVEQVEQEFAEAS